MTEYPTKRVICIFSYCILLFCSLILFSLSVGPCYASYPRSVLSWRAATSIHSSHRQGFLENKCPNWRTCSATWPEYRGKFVIKNTQIWTCISTRPYQAMRKIPENNQQNWRIDETFTAFTFFRLQCWIWNGWCLEMRMCLQFQNSPGLGCDDLI